MASNGIEKDETKVGYLERNASNDTNDARISRFTFAEQKKIIRRVDRRLVLTLGFLYCVSLMDRTNLGIALIAGMGVDLILIGSRYSIIVLVFFLTYIILQVIAPKLSGRHVLTIVVAPSDCHVAKDWPAHVPSNNHSTLGRHDDLLRLCQSLDFYDSTSSRSRTL